MQTRWEALASAFGGHYWTLRPFVPQFRLPARSLLAARWLTARAAARSGVGSAGPSEDAFRAPEPWSGHVEDSRWGRVLLTGYLHVPPGARSLLISVHGLGGNAKSLYLARSLEAAALLGWACLRINLRGAEGSGEDFYHAALTADLHAAVASPELSGFTEIHVLGYSLGGHLALCYGADAHDPRVRSVAAVCAPIDLARSSSHIDRPSSAPYCHYVLSRLKVCYAAVARRRSVPTPLGRVLRVCGLREWDACTVVPRHGFESVAEYYERASAASRLKDLRVPALLVNTAHDPMVPAHTVLPGLVGAPPRLDVRWLQRGGHVGLPVDVDLGERAPRGLEPQILSWMANAAAR
jgi:predicted alpha/beta-fold hydrolase